MDLSRCVAIVGAACRFPNGDTIEEFWHSLLNGMNSSVEIPPDRWNNDLFYADDKDVVGRMYVRHAALLTDVRCFDNKVFNITDEEAKYMDIQQKLVLEVTFKAIENAGFSVADMNGSDTAVFIGQMNDDYKVSFTQYDVNTYSATGSARSVVSNRISFQFDLRGASATIDTACSSSLTCIHMGIQSILSGDCTMAICGGVNATLSPATMVALAKARMSTEEGQCFTFSNKADGYLKGEGCGIVIMKKLDEAIRDGDNIWCAITTGVNQDGSTVSPITTPSRVQQEALIERLYKQCSIRPEYIQYIEAHGTGTKAGDPVETRALGNTIGAARKRAGKGKCPIGSVKTNIGHLESAAGVAGLIKTMLMMKHRKFVPSLHFDVPNPDIDFDSLNLTVTTKVADWPAKNGSPDMACVNSFGFGGTNVHAVIQEIRGKLPERTSLSGDGLLRFWPVVFSAATPEALLATLKHTHDALQDTPPCHLQQLAFTSTARRTQFRYRLSFLANNMTELKTNIARRVSQPLSSSEPVARNTRVVFVCCGMGTTFAGMGSELRRLEPVFEEALQAVDKLIMECTGWSVIDKMSSEHHMSQPEFSQPALFAIQVSLLKLLQFWGIVPSAIIGHSVGEVAASYLAKRLSLEDCVKVICHRGKLMSKVSGGSMMVAENFAPGVVDTVLKSFTGRVSIAAVNATNCYTLSGDSSALDEVASQLSAYQTGGQLLKKLNVNTAFHSQHMDPILNELRNALRDIEPVAAIHEGSMMAYSTVTGKLVAEADLSKPDYWVNNARGCVLFQSAFTNCLQAMTTSTNTVVVEIGPRPALGRYMRDIATSLAMKPTVLATMKPSAEQKELYTTLTSLYEVGIEPNWKNVFKGHETDICQLPEYQYQKKDLWHDLELFKERRMAVKSKQSVQFSFHCFVEKQNDNSTCLVHLNTPETDFVNEHQFDGLPTVPGAMYLELGLAGILLNTTFKPNMITMSVSFNRLLQITQPSEKTMTMETNVWHRDISDKHGKNNSSPSFDFDIAMNNAQYASGYAEVRTEVSPLPSPIDLQDIRSRCPKLIDHEAFYTLMTKANFTYGRRFRTVQSCSYSDDECLAEIVVHDEVANQFQRSILHPCLGDAVLQLSYMFIGGSLKNRSVQLVPRCIRRVKVLRTPEKTMFIHIRRNCSVENSAKNDCLIYDAVIANLYGEVYVTLDGVTVSATDGEIACSAVECLYSLVWNPSDQCTSNEMIESFMKSTYLKNNLPAPSSNMNYIVFSDTDGTATRILEKARSQGLCGSASQFIPADRKSIKSFHNDCNHLQHMLENPIEFYQRVLFCWPLNESISESSSSDDVLSAVIDVCFSLCQIAKYMISLNLNIPIIVVTRNVRKLLHSAETVADCDQTNLLRGVVGYTIQSTMRTIALEPDSPSIRCIDLTRCDDTEINSLVASLRDEQAHVELSFCQYQKWKPELLPGRCQLTSMMREGHYAANLPYQLLERNKQEFTFSPLLRSGEDVLSTKNGHFKYEHNNDGLCSVQKIRIDKSSLFHADQSKHNVLAADIIGCVEIREGRTKRVKVHVLGPCTSESEQFVNIHRCVPFASFPVDQPVISIMFLAWYVAVEVIRLGDLLRHSRPKIIYADALPEVRAIKSVLDSLVKKHTVGSSRKVSTSTVAIHFAKLPHDIREFVSKSKHAGEGFSLILTNVLVSESFINYSSDSHEVVYVPGLFLSDNAKRFQKFKDWLKRNENWLRQQYEDNEIRFDTSSIEVATRSSKQENSNKVTDNRKMHVLDLTSYKDVVPVAMSLQTMFRPNAHYIIVGGSRGLGWELMKHMVSVGATNVSSWSRNMPNEAIQQEVAILEKNTSCHITFQQVEVSISADVDMALMACRKLFPGTDLGGIFYGAVVLDDAALVKMELHQFSRVLQAKVKGTWNLHTSTKHQRLEFFVLHSSITSVLGNSGQTNYAAANAFQDAMAVYRRKTGLVGQSINWSALNVGVFLESVIATQRLKAEGLTPLSVADINECFDNALLSNMPQVMCARINWRVMLKKCVNDAQLIKRMYLFPFFTQRFEQYVQSMKPDTTQMKREVPDGKQVDKIKDFVRNIFVENIQDFDREPNDDVDAYTLGADSLNVISIVSNIRKVYNIPPTELQALSPLTVNEVYSVLLKHVNPADVNATQSVAEEELSDVRDTKRSGTWKGNDEHIEEATQL